MERKLRSSTCICIVVSTSSDLDALTRWRYVGKVPVCTPDRLPARLEEALATPVRREISRSAWAPTGEGPEAERLLGVIPRLSTPRPGEWARTLCLKRHELANLCRKAFGSPPREILRDYRRTYAGLGREAGYTWPRLALEAGYPTEMSFKRSIR